MQPVSPVIPALPECKEVIFGRNQPEYTPLPAVKWDDGMVLTHWRLSIWERLRLLFSGSIWLTVLTFNNPIQPVSLDVVCPVRDNKAVKP